MTHQQKKLVSTATLIWNLFVFFCLLSQFHFHSLFFQGGVLMRNHFFTAVPPGNKTSWRRRNDVSLFVPVTLQVRLK